MSTRQYSPRSRSNYNGLCIIDYDRRTMHGISNSQFSKFKDRSVIYSANLVKVHRTSRCRTFCIDHPDAQLVKLIENRSLRLVSGRANTTNLDIIHHDTCLVQKKPELGFVCAAETTEVVLGAFTSLRKDHECRVCAVKAHIEHTLDPNMLRSKALLSYLLARCIGGYVKVGGKV